MKNKSTNLIGSDKQLADMIITYHYIYLKNFLSNIIFCDNEGH